MIDTATNTVLTGTGFPIPVGGAPFWVAITPDGQHAYVTNTGSNTVSVIDTATNMVVTGPGLPIPVGTYPAGVAFSPDGKHAYVANNGSNSVSVINTATNTVLTGAGFPIPVGTEPYDVAIGSRPPGSVGDTHLTTFDGLLYDFQASGDFVLAQAGPEFVVQTRQASGAPTWPNASVNKAVATQIGKTRVAVCVAPARLVIDGKPNDLGDGKSLSLPGGVEVSRSGNVYFITRRSGDIVRAEVNATWINVSVRVSRWPAKVRGILANANGNVNEIETRDGIVLANPFSFVDLYHRYADSWRVPSNESLLSVCGEREIENGIPTKPFYANDLDPKLYERARAVCVAAGVKGEPLLDACTLDVTVIGSDTAAQVFVGATAPIAVGGVVITSGHSWLLWLLLVVVIVAVIAFILWMLLMRKTP